MDTKKVLKLVFRQPTAHYRVGFTQQHVHRTLPLPAPSTIIGMIHNLMGVKQGEQLRGFDIAVCGDYESIFYQFQLFRNIDKPYRAPYKEVHRGTPMPNQVQLLFNVYLRIYIAFDENFDKVNHMTRDQFIRRTANPTMPFIIGRREDLAILENLEITTADLTTADFPGKLELNHWATEKTTREYGLEGTVFQLGTFYKIEDKIRNFKRQRFYYIESQPLGPVKKGNQYENPRGWVDTIEINGQHKTIPVFFLGLNESES